MVRPVEDKMQIICLAYGVNNQCSRIPSDAPMRYAAPHNRAPDRAGHHAGQLSDMRLSIGCDCLT